MAPDRARDEPRARELMAARWWRNLRNRRTVEADLDRELAAHLDLLIDERVAAGMPMAQAERQARIELGGPEVVKDNVRDIRAGAVLQLVARVLSLQGWRSWGNDKAAAFLA